MAINYYHHHTTTTTTTTTATATRTHARTHTLSLSLLSGKERFVTGAYRRKLEEDKKWAEEQARK